MGLLTLATMMSVVLVRCHFKGQKGKRPPAWLRQMVLGVLARVLCVTNDAVEYAAEEVSCEVTPTPQPPPPPTNPPFLAQSKLFDKDSRMGLTKENTFLAHLYCATTEVSHQHTSWNKKMNIQIYFIE